jgi:hypothetical protein
MKSTIELPLKKEQSVVISPNRRDTSTKNVNKEKDRSVALVKKEVVNHEVKREDEYLRKTLIKRKILQ